MVCRRKRPSKWVAGAEGSQWRREVNTCMEEKIMILSIMSAANLER